MTIERTIQVLDEIAENTAEDEEAVEALNKAILLLKAIEAGFRLS